MKTSLRLIQNVILAGLLLTALVRLCAQGTAFTYQGRLNASGNPANGSYDFRFRLASDELGNNYAGSALLTNGVMVADGLFAARLDFGGVFTGSNYWLQVDVRTNGGGSYSTLTPLQPLTPAPYAIFAQNVGSGGLASGTYGNAVTLNNPANRFVGLIAGDGAGLTNVNAWRLTGNAGFAPGTTFLGTTDDQPLELKVNNALALRLEPSAAPNVIGGGPNNGVMPGRIGAAIGGGADQNVNADYGRIGGGRSNSVVAIHGAVGGGVLNRAEGGPAPTVSGGQGNTAGGHWTAVGGGLNNIALGYTSAIGGGGGNNVETNADHSTISGGLNNRIQRFSFRGAIGGGQGNLIKTNVFAGTIAGGYFNTIQTNADYATIGGGNGNTIQTNADYATIGGGDGHTIRSNALWATIGGGQANAIQGYARWAFIGGGQVNSIQANAAYGVIGGGNGNTIQSDAITATIAGGQLNVIHSGGASIGGGVQNSVQRDALFATIAGGQQNDIGTNADYSVIGGGSNNDIESNAEYATIPGGRFNQATNYAFAAGRRAAAVHSGAFVWSDGNGVTTASASDNSVTFRASGGYRFFTGIVGGGAQLPAGATSWTVLSDRNLKKDVRPVDCQLILDKLSRVPVSQWHYAWEEQCEPLNLGPMAQDFKAAFYPGRDDKSISTLEFDGVALAAIQGLNQKLTEELKRRDAENADLKARLSMLEKLVANLNPKGN